MKQKTYEILRDYEWLLDVGIGVAIFGIVVCLGALLTPEPAVSTIIENCTQVWDNELINVCYE